MRGRVAVGDDARLSTRFGQGARLRLKIPPCASEPSQSEDRGPARQPQDLIALLNCLTFTPWCVCYANCQPVKLAVFTKALFASKQWHTLIDGLLADRRSVGQAFAGRNSSQGHRRFDGNLTDAVEFISGNWHRILALVGDASAE